MADPGGFGFGCQTQALAVRLGPQSAKLQLINKYDEKGVATKQILIINFCLNIEQWM